MKLIKAKLWADQESFTLNLCKNGETRIIL